MKTSFRCTPWLLCFTSLAVPAGADPLTEENSCVLCHSDEYLWDSDTRHLFVTPEDLAGDVHWQIGLRCHDCHGGNPDTVNLREAHAVDDGFRVIGTPADIPAFCGHCHADEQYMKQANPDARSDVVARFLDSVHGRHLQQVGGADAATCTSCHAAHGTPAIADPQSLAHPAQMVERCGSCHQQQRDSLLADVHRHAGTLNDQAVGAPLGCNQCHGDDMHAMLPVSDRESPVYAHNQVDSCGQCHQDAAQLYLYTRHGQNLQAGLLVAPVCADCHGAHGILPREDPLSTLHPGNLETTCGRCHRSVPDWVKLGMHGQPLPRPTTAAPATFGLARGAPPVDPGKVLRSISIPERIIDDLKIQVAFNNEEVFFRFQYQADTAGIGISRYEDGEWKQEGASPWGFNEYGLHEDRLTFMLDDGSVPDFAVFGCTLTCHDGMRFLHNVAETEGALDHPYLTGTLRQRDERKYLTATTSGDDWRDLVSEEDRGALHQKGYFLDKWQWRAHRSTTNWDAENHRPKRLFDPAKTGSYALKREDLIGQQVTRDDISYLSEDLTIEWTDDYVPQEGDVVPRRLLREPEGSRGATRAESRWQDGTRTVILRRALDTGYPLDDKALRAGEVYQIAFAVHRGARGSRWHMITFPHELGMGVQADINAAYFTGSEPNWDAVVGRTVKMFYPGQVTREWLTSTAHPGSHGLIGGVKCAECHSPGEVTGYGVRYEYGLLQTALAAGGPLVAEPEEAGVAVTAGVAFTALLGFMGVLFGAVVAVARSAYTRRAGPPK